MNQSYRLCTCVACREIRAARVREEGQQLREEIQAILRNDPPAPRYVPQPTMMRSTGIEDDLTARIREIQQAENRYQQCRRSFDSRCICLYCGDHYAAATSRGERTTFPEDNYE